VHADRLRVRLKARRRGNDNLAFMRQIRLSYPKRQRIYWVQDNLSANWTPDIRAFAEANNIELVPPRPTPATSTASSATSCRSASSSSRTPTSLNWDAFN